MAALNTTTFAYALKRLYTNEKIKTLTYQSNPFLAMVKKDENFVGANFTEAVVYGDVLARNTSFSVALAAKAGTLGKAYLITRVKDYAIASLDSEVLLSSQGNEGALISATTREMDGAINALSRSIAIGMYGNGSGQVGTISTSQSTLVTAVLTLSNASDVCNFEAGHVVVFAANDTSALRDAGTLTVSAVDRDAGTLTMSTNISTITNVATGDAVFIYGDYATASDRNKITGLAGWVPSTAPGATAFFGVDRSTDVSRLGGIRVTGTGLPLSEAIIKGAARLGREGGMPDTCFMSFSNWENLVNQLGSKVMYSSKEVAGVGFPGLTIHGPKGPIEIYPDQNCPSNRIYLLTLKTWTLRSLGPAPRILDLDGMKFTREYNADALEIRCAFFGNLSCNAPGWNAVITV